MCFSLNNSVFLVNLAKALMEKINIYHKIRAKYSEFLKTSIGLC